MSDAEGVRGNIEWWLVGEERLDVRAMYDELERRYGPDSPTNYCAKLLAAVMEYETLHPFPRARACGAGLRKGQ